MGEQRSDAVGAGATDHDVIEAYRAGLTIGELAAIFGVAPGRVAQLIVATGAARRKRLRHGLRPLAATS